MRFTVSTAGSRNNFNFSFLIPHSSFSLCFAIATFGLLGPIAALAHPGSTNVSGCHRCTEDCELWANDHGQFHCHDLGSSGPAIRPKFKTVDRRSKTSLPTYRVKHILRQFERRRGTDSPFGSLLTRYGRTRLYNPRTDLLRGRSRYTPYTRRIARGHSVGDTGNFLTPPARDQFRGVQVTKVNDGETIEVLLPAGEQAVVSLAGITSPSRRGSIDPVPCYGKESAGRLKRRLARRTVALESVPNLHFDRLGRIVRYVHLNGEDIGASLVRNGYVFAHVGYDHPKQAQYEELEALAYQQRLGVWSAQCSYWQNTRAR